MIEIKQNGYYKVIPLLDQGTYNNYLFQSVAENKVRGKVFVDNVKDPTVCLIAHKYGMSLLCGNDTNDSFNNKLIGFLKNDSINNHMTKWMLVFPEQKWTDKLTLLLGDDLLKVPDIKEEEIQKYKTSKKILQTERVEFKFDVNAFKKITTLPSGFVLKKIDQELYEKITGSVVPKNFWDSAEDFLQNGIGFSLLFDNKVVSSCFSSAIFEDKLEFGVETDKEFRGKGYSIYPVLAMAEYSLSIGYEPVWACRKENIGSVKLARKAGFSASSYHSYYTIPIL